MDDATTYADEHENGQLRLAVPGEQVSLLPLPDSEIPRVLGSDAAIAVGRFEPDGPTGYHAKFGGPVRATRAEAEADQLNYYDAQEFARPGP